MKKLKIKSNFKNPTEFLRSCTYKSLFDHNEVVEAFIWNSVHLEDLFEDYYNKRGNKKEAKVGILKVFACASEN